MSNFKICYVIKYSLGNECGIHSAYFDKDIADLECESVASSCESYRYEVEEVVIYE